MMWRVRTTLDDRPGILAEIALACGRAEVNIVAMQVFPTAPLVTDEFVVSATESMTDTALAAVFRAAGGENVAVTRVGAEAVADAPTRWLEAVQEVIEADRDVDAVLRELLDTTPPDVADYAGHDVLDLRRRDGSALRISRAVPFTSIEKARAQALLSLVGDAGREMPLLAPTTGAPLPLVRTATLADLESVAALHQRCSIATLYQRYQVPLRLPLTTRLARRLVLPERGTALVVQVGFDVVGHGVLDHEDLGSGEATWTFRLIIEDAWHHRGVGTTLIRQAAGRARAHGADQLTFVTHGSNDTLLRTVGSAGFVARVERHDDDVHLTVPLRLVDPISDE